MGRIVPPQVVNAPITQAHRQAAQVQDLHAVAAGAITTIAPSGVHRAAAIGPCADDRIEIETPIHEDLVGSTCGHKTIPHILLGVPAGTALITAGGIFRGTRRRYASSRRSEHDRIGAGIIGRWHGKYTNVEVGGAGNVSIVVIHLDVVRATHRQIAQVQDFHAVVVGTVRTQAPAGTCRANTVRQGADLRIERGATVQADCSTPTTGSSLSF